MVFLGFLGQNGLSPSLLIVREVTVAAHNIHRNRSHRVMSDIKDTLDSMFDEADRNAENCPSFIQRAKELERRRLIDKHTEALEGLSLGQLRVLDSLRL